MRVGMSHQWRGAEHLQWLFLLMVLSVIVGSIAAYPAQRAVEKFLRFWTGYWIDRVIGQSVSSISLPITHAIVLWSCVVAGVFPLVLKVRWQNAAMIASAIVPALVLHEFFFVPNQSTVDTRVDWTVGSGVIVIVLIACLLTALPSKTLRLIDREGRDSLWQRGLTCLLVATSLVLSHGISRFNNFNNALTWVGCATLCIVIIGSCLGWIRSATVNGLLKGVFVGLAIPVAILIFFVLGFFILNFVIGIPAVPGL